MSKDDKIKELEEELSKYKAQITLGAMHNAGTDPKIRFETTAQKVYEARQLLQDIENLKLQISNIDASENYVEIYIDNKKVFLGKQQKELAETVKKILTQSLNELQTKFRSFQYY